MANEEKKDFNAMLHDSKDMPKFQMITDPKSIEKYGGNRMYFAPPIDYDKVMKQVPFGKVITFGKIREYFAKVSGAEAQKEKLEAEGHTIIQKGRKNIRYYVKDYENVLF
ncbi:MAG: hypothetical protein PUE84_00460 [Firmicutes bacterium]|nr:hypothetical protein [Bacillota bacterium]